VQLGLTHGPRGLQFIRMTVGALPNSAATKARWGLPLGAIVQPMAVTSEPVPLVDFGASAIVRCRKCRTYINPFVQWTDGGRRFRCNVCGSLTEVKMPPR
jgi:protein transport protein SEC24